MNYFCRSSNANEQVPQKSVVVTPSCVAGLYGDHSKRTQPLPAMLKYEDIDNPYKIREVRIHVCWLLFYQMTVLNIC